MLIDWFTVVAQIINFLILVALLRYFLYGRIIAAIDRRQEQIASRWNEADERQKEAAEAIRSYGQKQQEMDAQRENLLTEARKQAEQRREELVREAREETERLAKRWQESLRQERDEFLKDLRRRAGRGTCSIARRVLADLADDDLERRVVHVFLDRIQSLDETRRNDLLASANAAGDSLKIRSAFEIPMDLRESITGALRSLAGDNVQAEFETEPRLICGIELFTDGRKLAWDMSDYLDDLEERLVATLDRDQTEQGGDDLQANAADAPKDGDGNSAGSKGGSRGRHEIGDPRS